jgi:hypothetical protein
MTISMISYDKIIPALNEKNWKIIANDKVEIIHGDIYSPIDKNQWIYPIIKQYKGSVNMGFYVNSEKPDELVRISGLAPDIQVILFRKV